MSDPNTGSKGWWQTLPGLFTAIAAIITAFTGLVVAIGGLGIFHRSPSPPSRSPTTSSSQGPSSSGGAAPAGSETEHRVNADPSARSVPLPAMTQVTSGTSVYKLLSLQAVSYSPDKISLHFTIRMTNNGSDPSNFWSSSFRLRVGDSLQAPVNALDELVDPNSSKEGAVEFVIPAATSKVGLQMGDVGKDRPDITIQLSSANLPSDSRNHAP